MNSELAAKIAGRRVVASVSGGKDSAALSLWLTEHGIEHDRVFMDTGWEHPATYEYLRGPLTKAIGAIVELQPALPMVQLLRKRGTFPSRLRRFCTEELKVFPLRDYLAARTVETINAVGIRAEESAKRALMTEWEWSKGLDSETWRPLIAWKFEDVRAIHQRHGLAPNPLYLRGAERVGCWPCIFARKAEIKHISETDPDRIALIEQLEAELTERAGADRRWFHGKTSRSSLVGIREVAEWSTTDRGGKQHVLFDPPDDGGCMRWGLCDTAAGGK